MWRGCWRGAAPTILWSHTWSRYAPETQGVLIVYASMYGNTENAAQALATSLCDKDVYKRQVSRLPALFLKAGFSAADAAGLFVVCCLGFGFPASYFIDSRMASASASSSVRLSVPMDEARLSRSLSTCLLYTSPTLQMQE